MSKPLSDAQLEAAVLRHLLTQGQPCDFTSIRFGPECLSSVPRRHLWAAIRALIERSQVSYAYRVERTTYEGFTQTMSYPVFWVNRGDLVKDGAIKATAPDWWRAFITILGGEGVRP